MKIHKNVAMLLKVLITVGLLAYLFHRNQISFSSSLGYLRNANLLAVLAALLVLLAGQVLCTIRWTCLLGRMGAEVRWKRAANFYFIGMFFSLFFPSLVGGDVVKMFYARRETGRPMTLVAASVYLDRAVGFLSLMLWGLAGALLHPLAFDQRIMRPLALVGLKVLPLWTIPAAIALLFVLVNACLFFSGPFRLASRLLERIRLPRVAEKVNTLHDAMEAFRSRPASLLLPFGLSMVNIGLVVVTNWLIAFSMGIPVPFSAMSSVVCLATVVLMLPLTINGIGIRENAFVAMLALLGIAPEAALAVSIVNFLVVVLSSLPGGVCYSMLKKEIALPEGEMA